LHQLAHCVASSQNGGFSIVKEAAMAKTTRAVPEGFHTVTPQLILENTAQAIDWYKRALGAEELSRAAGPDGTHARRNPRR
jgi:hypothetical protein